ncbi:MAG: hypothetical protein H6581_05310 [Bacteroidia bacterium]|nr:hypothetical protein [Bacteroidia bacterium]
MENCREIIQALSPEEKELIRSHLKTLTGSSRRLQLFDLVDSNRVKSDMEAAKILYSSKPNSAYSHLKTRLEDIILDLIFPLRVPFGSESYFQHKFQCWRRIMISNFFLSRQAFRPAARYLEEAINLAMRFELAAELLIAEDLKIQHFPRNLQDIPPAESGGEISRAKMFMEIFEMKKQFRELSQTDLFQNLDAGQLSCPIEKFAQMVVSGEAGNNFCRVKYWGYQIMIIHEKIRGNYSRAFLTASALWNLVQEKGELFSQPEILDAGLAYARMAFINKNPFVAFGMAHSIRNKSSAGSLVELDIQELFFLKHFYAFDFSRAEEVLAKSKIHPQKLVSDFHQSLWKYYEAHLAFVRGNYKDSLHLLRNNPELMKHKSKWLLGHKLLELYNLISLRQYDLVEFKLNALKQLLKRQKMYNIQRGKYIANALSILLRKNFDFKQTLTALQNFNSLQNNAIGFAAWVPLNFEVFSVENFLRLGELADLGSSTAHSFPTIISKVNPGLNPMSLAWIEYSYLYCGMNLEAL